MITLRVGIGIRRAVSASARGQCSKNIAVHKNLSKIGKDSAIAVLGKPDEDFTRLENLRKILKLKRDSFALVNTISYYSYTLCDESENIPNLDSLHNVEVIKNDSTGL